MDSLFLKSFLPEIFLSVSLLVALIYNSFLATSSKYNFPLLDNNTFFQTIFILFCCIFILLNVDFGSLDLAQLFVNDITSLCCKLVVLISLLCSLILGQNYYLATKINLFEFFTICLLSVLSLLILLSSTDLISIYISLEMQSLSFYILAAINRNSVFSTEAGLKYFVLGAFVSGIFLFGASLLYGTTGTTNLYSFSLLFSEKFPSHLNNSIFFFGAIFVLITFLFKLTAAPFHLWSPDVYEGAPLNSTIIFVLVPKLVLVILIFRLVYFSFFTFLDFFQPILLFSGVLSVLFGSLMAFRQKKLKRLLIYSSISHVGFLLLGCSSGTLFGVVSVVFYTLFYILTNILIWGILAFFQESIKLPIYLTDFSQIARLNPVLGLTFLLSLFSLAGIPPMVGFAMKFFIFTSAFNADLFGISVLIILLSVLSSFYYIRLIKIMYFEKNISNDFLFQVSNFSDLSCTLISFCFFLLFWGFFDPNVFLLFSYKVALGFGVL